MYQVAIVDDEPLIRKSLSESIDWDTFECEVCLQAPEVKAITEYLKDNEVDILLLDINLPGVDGLTFAKEIKKKNNNIKVIMVSAYKDFQYVKQALQIGVFDYIAKPISNQEVVSIVKKAILAIKEEKDLNLLEKLKQDETKMLNNYFAKSRQLVQSQILKNILTNNEISDLSEDLKVIPQNSSKHAAIVIKSLSKIEDSAINKKYILKYIEENQGYYDFEIKQTIINNNIVFVVLFTNKISQKDAKKTINKFCKSILNYISDWVEVNFYIGVSSIYSDTKEMWKAYQEAFNVAENQFFIRNKSISFREDLEKNDRNIKFSIIHDLDYFYNFLQRQNIYNEEIETEINKLIDEISVYSKGNISLAKSILSEVCITIGRLYLKQNTHNDFSVEQIQNDINKLYNIQDSKKYIINFIKIISQQEKHEEYSPIITSAMAFIKKHYCENISLETVSDSISINPSYLSRLIKKETGKNFIDIILEERINTAKQLLQDPKLRLNEIASLVGYKDYAYFYQVFKKNMGITPMDFRKNNRKL
ncbi:response regulator [Clostridium grantii]|uniref:Stage 0 sporulation protein A homolog n=1 Tax=Clostridium grantii DSM 8605 TaxID=1121316 RepID=A0A1M5T442_9CLOT|nr:response regulator [Clostridium grantii]SHH45505.1 Two-component response regulator, YesN/AraC family, consists of REC and AraC-type DNA-binding domains [Clostridium grantii DSM 8605]